MAVLEAKVDGLASRMLEFRDDMASRFETIAHLLERNTECIDKVSAVNHDQDIRLIQLEHQEIARVKKGEFIKKIAVPAITGILGSVVHFLWTILSHQH
jgi:hypothetical protein